jgi:hypothetical protein
VEIILMNRLAIAAFVASLLTPAAVHAQLGIWCFPSAGAPCVSLETYAFAIIDEPDPDGFRLTARLSGTISGLEPGRDYTLRFGLPIEADGGAFSGSLAVPRLVTSAEFTAVGTSASFDLERDQVFGFTSVVSTGGPADLNMSLAVDRGVSAFCWTSPDRAAAVDGTACATPVPEPAALSLVAIGLLGIASAVGRGRRRSLN